MSEKITIEKGVPLPPDSAAAQIFEVRCALVEMEVGDSVLVSASNTSLFEIYADRIAMKLFCGPYQDGKCRVWRVA